MWKIVIIANALVMFLFWIASELAIALAYNHFVQYPGAGGVIVLPLITSVALSARKFSVTLPMAWSLVSFFYYKFTKQKKPADRNEYLLIFTLITVCIGFSILAFFGLAGILPYLRIGMVIK
jgi:uncharacterized membrane protein YwzB